MMKSIVLSAACLALTMALAIVAPLAVPIGLAALIVLFAPEPFQALQTHPRSIFETRRAGLA